MLVWCLKEWTPLTSKCKCNILVESESLPNDIYLPQFQKILVCAQLLSESHLIGADEGLGDRLRILILFGSERLRRRSEWS
jgi:hypothetical protein